MKLIKVECEICTFPLGVLDLDSAYVPLKASMFKPIDSTYRAPFPDWKSLGLLKDLELGSDPDNYFKCPQCKHVPFINHNRVIDTDKRYYEIKEKDSLLPEVEFMKITSLDNDIADSAIMLDDDYEGQNTNVVTEQPKRAYHKSGQYKKRGMIKR